MLSDSDYMKRALELAQKARPISPPNPSVGCVIVRNHQVLGEGFTQKTGSDHAEIQAIKNANAKGFDIEGATIYVTLEPCSHYGRTPPCAMRLIKEKVARVVVACLDPNPLVAGRGLRMLRDAGIEVETGVLESEAWQMNAGFMTRMTEQRPWVRAKVAMSLDGFTALANGFRDGNVLVACAREIPDKVQSLCQLGAEVLSLPGKDNRVDLVALMAELAKREVNEVHLEAGAILTGEMVRLGLVDELLCYIAPKILGAGRSAFRLPAIEKLSDCQEWLVAETTLLGNDVRIILRKRK